LGRKPDAGVFVAVGRGREGRKREKDEWSGINCLGKGAKGKIKKKKKKKKKTKNSRFAREGEGGRDQSNSRNLQNAHWNLVASGR